MTLKNFINTDRWLTTPQGHILLLMVFGLVHFFWGLDAYGILHNNEGLYAEIPREMIERNTFIIPYLNGVPYLEKPPLLYWLIAASYKFFGVSTYSARLIPAASGFVTIVMLYSFCYGLKKSTQGFLGALVLLGSGAFIVFSRMIYFDGLLTCFLTGSLLCFYRAQQQKSHYFLTLSYTFLALGILTKGFVALILYGLVVLSWILAQRCWSLILWMLSPVPLLVLIVISVPWHLAAHLQDPDFSYFYFINEHVLRFLGQRLPKDYYHGPLYYYGHRLLLYGLPWTLVTYQAIKTYKGSPLKTFLILWALVLFLFFSLSEAKANYYIMTLLPPLALLVGGGFAAKPAYVRGAPLVLSIIFMGAGYCATFVWGTPFPFALLFILTSLSLWVYARPKFKAWIPVVLAMHTSALILFALKIMPAYEDKASAVHFQGPFHKPCLYRDFEKMSSVVFYAQTLMPVYQSLSNDLRYGLERVPNMTVTTPEDAKARCQGFFVYHEQTEAFFQEFPDYRMRQHKGMVAYYTKPPA